jgi:hypothetical protein
MGDIAQFEDSVGRADQLRAICAAIYKRESRLIWGPADAGKTVLIKKAISEMPDLERRSCIYWTGAASTKQLLSHLIGRLFDSGDPHVRKKVLGDGVSDKSLGQWLQRQRSLRLRGILFTTLTQGHYLFFLDHFPPATHNMARLLKEITNRCKTPIYLLARHYSQEEIGYAWSIYWNDSLRIHLGALKERDAKALLESCIHHLRLDSLDLRDFRRQVLRLSGRFPGSIVKMCELAANSKYHYGDRIKIKLVHVDYLMGSTSSAETRPTAFLP